MSQKLSVGVTGVSGFVGSRFSALNNDRFQLRNLDLRSTKISELDLAGLDSVVHLAGLAHQMKPVPDELYYKINVDLTKELIEHCKTSGVKQFVYISSVKVFGDHTTGVLNERSACSPSDPYGDSKCRAEELVKTFSSPGLHVAIIRPPVVYGPGVKGNIFKLMQLAAKNIALPFRKINNARSMVFVDNLVELINAVIEKNAEGTFIAGDAAPVSTEQLMRMIQGNLIGKEKLFSIPVPVRTLLKKFKPALYSRLFGSYVIDNSLTNRSLQFTPPYETKEGIAAMVSWFKTNKKTR